jgi:hypothetical protein
VLRGCRRKNGRNFADQLSSKPEASGLIEEVFHLSGHISESCRGSDDDCIVVDEFVRRGEGRFLVELEMACLRNISGTSSGTRFTVAVAPASRAPLATALAISSI